MTKLCQHTSNPIGGNSHSSVGLTSGWSDSSEVPQEFHRHTQWSTVELRTSPYISVSLPYTASGQHRYYDFLFQREKNKIESELHKTGTPWCLNLKSKLVQKGWRLRRERNNTLPWRKKADMWNNLTWTRTPYREALVHPYGGGEVNSRSYPRLLSYVCNSPDIKTLTLGKAGWCCPVSHHSQFLPFPLPLIPGSCYSLCSSTVTWKNYNGRGDYTFSHGAAT